MADTGIGISPKDSDRAFEWFIRWQNTLRQETIGPGVGLSVVKGVAEALEGRVTVDRVTGDGLTFEVWLQRWVDAETTERAPGGTADG